MEFVVEKGIVKSFDKHCGTGMISRAPNIDVRFYTESVVGRSRAGLKKGDSVEFEINNIKNFHNAIKVRKCK